MTLMDAAASTAFALRSSASSSAGSSAGAGGGVLDQQTRNKAAPSAATRLGSIDRAPRSENKEGGRRPTTTTTTTPPPPRPLFSFGAIADVQYADQDDGWNFKKDHRRYYRGGLLKLTEAVDWWLKDETHRFALQLGDVIDGCNKRNGCSEAALSSVKAEVDRLAASLPLGVLNSLGNHELYNFPKERWAKELDCSNRAKAASLRPSAPRVSAATRKHESLDTNVHVAEPPSLVPGSGLPLTAAVVKDQAGEQEKNVGEEEGKEEEKEEEEEEEECFYYSFCPDDSHRFIALDCYDVSAIREEPGPDELKAEGGKEEEKGEEEEGVRANGATGGVGEEGVEVLSKHNPNDDKNHTQGMEGLNKRFVQYNGGVGAKQLLWLEDELRAASRAGQRVVGFGHVPIHPGDPPSHTLIWNYQEVLEVMHKFDCVAMFLSGHRHRETYFQDEKEIHHVSLAAALEAPPGQEAFASIDVYRDTLELRGHGVVQSRTLSARALSLS